MSESSTTAESTVQGSVGKTHYVRVAVAQLEYHPAIIAEMRSPLEDPGGLAFFLPPKEKIPDALWDAYGALCGRIRTQYTRYMARRVKRILQQCDAWGVRVMVFPEYSIPWQILPELAKAAPNIVVVVGTHTVEKNSKEVYTQLGWSKEKLPKNGQAVAPVLYGGQLIGLSGKFNAAVAVGEEIKPATSWQPIDMPAGIPGPMGVMVCLDFLYRENDAHRTLVGEKLDNCHFLAIPSLTPSRTVERFEDNGWEEVKGYGRPVLYTNDSKEGGATIFVDEKERSGLTPFPEHVGYLVAKDEGVVVADVDLGFKRAGGSGRLDAVDPVKPFAMASLVYRARPAENDYAVWLDGLRAIVADHIDDLDDEDMERFHAHVRGSKGILQAASKGSGARGDRLRKLNARLENITFVDDARRLTREVVLEPQVLPFGAFCAAVARGAADVLERWVVKHGQLGPVLSRLREPWDKLEREMATWTQQARLEAADVVKAVGGDNVPHDPKGQIPIVEVYEGEIGAQFKEEYKKAKKASEEGRYIDEREIYYATQRRIEALLEKTDPNDAKDRPLFRTWIARCRLHAALTTLNLQESESAREQLLAIPLDDLLVTDRMHLAEGLALVGEIDRGRAILPSKDVIPQNELGKYVEVVLSLDLLDGRLPDILIDSTMISLRAAPLLLDKGERAEVARRSLDIIKKNRRDPLITSLAIQFLTEALRRSIIEMPPEHEGVIPKQDRAEIIRQVEDYFERVRREDLPASARQTDQRVEAMFRVLMDDQDWIARHGAVLDDDSVPWSDPTHPRNVAHRLATEGRLDEALRLLPNDHPWGTRLDRVGLLVIAKRHEQALEELLCLAKEYEHDPKASIEGKAARLLQEHGRLEEALAHAKRAFAELPSIGHRIQWADLLQLNGHAQEAWELLKDVDARSRPLVLRARAIIAEKLGRLDAAEEAWGAYVDLQPKDGSAQVHYAQILFAVHKQEKAAAVAWKVFGEQSDRLKIDELFSCGQLQRLAGPLNSEQERRIKEITTKLLERFPGDAKAEHLRLALLSMLGKLPEDTAPIDFPKLVGAGYASQKTGIEPLVKFLDDRRAYIGAVEVFRRRGAIPLTTSCAIGGVRLAVVVTRILERSRAETGFLSPPISFVDQPAGMQLEGATILVSDLELLLIVTLNLAPMLQKALGESGRLVLFERTYNRIVADAAQLRIDARPDELAKKEALLRKVERLPRVEADPIAPYDDAAAARRANGLIVEDTTQPVKDGVTRISSRGFLDYLHDKRILDDDQYHRILPTFADIPEPATSLVERLPSTLVLPWYWVEELEKVGALDATFVAYRDVLRVGPGALRQFGVGRDELLDQIRAHELADRVHALVNEPWIRKIPEPKVTELPHLLKPTKTSQRLIQEPLYETLTYTRQILDHRDWWRLSAEFFGSTTLGALETMQEFDWENNEHYVRLEQQVREAATRDLTLPSLVRLLVKDQKSADERLFKLAELGFPDALGGGEVLRLARRFKGLGTGEPERILDHQEWIACEPGHLGGDFARLRLAQTYAAVIFASFSAPERTEVDRDALLKTLLGRQERIGQKTGANALDEVFAHLAGRTAEFWQLAFKEEGEYLVLKDDGPIGKLWSVLLTWSRADGARAAAHGRAMREIWRALNSQPGGPPPEVIGALGLAHEPLPQDGLEFSLMAPGYEALAILSAVWKENQPFRGKIHGELIDRGVALLADDGIGLQGGRLAQYRVQFTEDDEATKDRRQVDTRAEQELRPNEAVSTPIKLPVEALFLRLPRTLRPRFAARLKRVQGMYDEECYRLLEAIENEPENEEHLREYAEHAAGALFRLVQDDPAFLRIWPQAQFGTLGKLGKFHFLLEILSEPDTPLPSDQSFRQILYNRLKSPEGFWCGRVDDNRLLRSATEIPGMLASLALVGKFHDQVFGSNVESALDHIDHPDEHPAGRLAADMFFLRAAAAFRPLVRISGADVDLRDELPGRFHRLLLRVIDAPKPDTLAAFEPALLQCCASVIQRLAGHALPIRWGVWLTWRLFQWLCMQLEAISADARLAGMQRLTANPPQFGAPLDRLDPAGFGRAQFDHRLAAVLHALGCMDVAAALARESVENILKAGDIKILNDSVRNVSSPEIEQTLMSLVQKPWLEATLTSKLDWNAPGSMPDLALFALLGMNATRFADLSAETRTRCLEKLPQDLASLEQSNAGDAELAHRVIFAAANGAAKLTADERKLLEDKLVAMHDHARVPYWRWFVFTCLYVAGEDHLEEPAWQTMHKHLGGDFQNALAGVSRLLLATANRKPEQLEERIEFVMNAAKQCGADAGALVAGGLARIVGAGKPASKKIGRKLLAKLAKHPELGNHPSMREVRGFFGIKEATS